MYRSFYHHRPVSTSTALIIGVVTAIVLVVIILIVVLRWLYVRKSKTYAQLNGGYDPEDPEAPEMIHRQSIPPAHPNLHTDAEGYSVPSLPPPASIAPRAVGYDTEARGMEEYQGYYATSPEIVGEDRNFDFCQSRNTFQEKVVEG
ncbi:hypothetical protein VM1G_08393 [Cytospora mali]|uniref:Uncharacterized protein n=1 Tax=Cytospora mali TaxID=578113 RepID=A0A194WA47_CYTMA|nr:hypothetical protein VM1G_08393 [Valsa mali]